MKQSISLAEALTDYDRDARSDQYQEAEKQRAAILERFPLGAWAEMTLEDYAVGQPGRDDTFCRWVEFRSKKLGSMKGGSSRKLIVYKHRKKPGWYFPENEFKDEREAWTAVRDGFIHAFRLAEEGNWSEIDDISALRLGPALRTKTLHIYFPDEVLPIYSLEHIKHFLSRLSVSVEKGRSTVQHNRKLLQTLRADDRFDGWSTTQMAWFLYHWSHPQKAPRIRKIAPGEQAKYWDDCQKDGYICVGWDQVGDLTEFEDKEEFTAAFRAAFPDYNRSTQTKKANELWTLMELEPGDIVVANKGTSHVLALGTVNDEGYSFRSERDEYQHVVGVDWGPVVGKDIPTQKRWGVVTVAKVPMTLYQTILDGSSGMEALPVDSIFRELDDAITRKGQIVLYGPPGTGKTYHARRFGVWWLLNQNGIADAARVVSDRTKFRSAESSLSTSVLNHRVWWLVANPKEWSWDILRKDGKVDFRYGRLKRNYPQVQVGDLVIGYQSTPDKKLMAVARISRAFSTDTEGNQTIGVEYVADLKDGLSYEELRDDPVLSKSEPIRFNNQGTLFALTEAESQCLFERLVERGNETLWDLVDQDDTVGQLTRITFHASYSYEDFIEGFRPVANSSDGLSLRLEDGVFKRVCREAVANPDRKYLVMIDEINRANMAKVFGELLTLLEIDKRDLTVTLPQSKQAFSIPQNVYLLATMNTADRSIKLLDAALRRRFSFIEMMPDCSLLEGEEIDGLPLDSFLAKLNRRVAIKFGPEKQIGHSFLMEGEEAVGDAEEFARRFRQDILPLLQEYCYDDYATLAELVGTEVVDTESFCVNGDVTTDPQKLLAALQKVVSSPEDTND